MLLTPCVVCGQLCAGGDPASAAAVPRRCPRGLWTRVEVGDSGDDPYSTAGATNVAHCLAPPGWFVPDNNIDEIQECPPGSYKEVRPLAATQPAPSDFTASFHFVAGC